MPLRRTPGEVFQSLKLSRRVTPLHFRELLRGKRQLSAAPNVLMLPQQTGGEVRERRVNCQVMLIFERPNVLRCNETEQAAQMLRTIALVVIGWHRWCVGWTVQRKIVAYQEPLVSRIFLPFD